MILVLTYQWVKEIEVTYVVIEVKASEDSAGRAYSNFNLPHAKESATNTELGKWKQSHTSQRELLLYAKSLMLYSLRKNIVSKAKSFEEQRPTFPTEMCTNHQSASRLLRDAYEQTLGIWPKLSVD